MTFYIPLFILSCLALALAGHWLIRALSRIAKFLGWREFVVAFIAIALGASIPNLFVGISAALHKIPILSFSEVIGGNVVDLTLSIALATLVAKGISAESRLVQTSSIFTLVIAVLPLLLVLDGNFSRGDGIISVLAFVFYICWLFSKKERFTKVYNGTTPKKFLKSFPMFFKDLSVVLAGIILLILGAEGIVRSAAFFAVSLNAPLVLIGLLIVGLGNCLPEIYFAIISARSGQTWMIMGDLMGAVIVPATLVLGIVGIISPFSIPDFSPFVLARFFLVLAAVLFLIFIRTGQKITRREAIILLLLYFVFVISEIISR